MRRFDVFRVDDPSGVVAVLVIQSDFYLDLPSVLVIPLYDAEAAETYPVINSQVTIEGRALIIKTEEMTSAPSAALKDFICNLGDEAFAIQSMIDRLLAGY